MYIIKWVKMYNIHVPKIKRPNFRTDKQTDTLFKNVMGVSETWSSEIAVQSHELELKGAN